MNCTRCNKRLSKKTARLIDGKVLCSACMFGSGPRSERGPAHRDRDDARRAETRRRLGCLSTGKPGPAGYRPNSIRGTAMTHNKTSLQDELLPCPAPWCGDVDVAMLNHLGANRSIICRTCGTTTPRYPTEAEAITAWNTRPTPIDQTTDAGLAEERQVARLLVQQILNEWERRREELWGIPEERREAVNDFADRFLAALASRQSPAIADREALEFRPRENGDFDEIVARFANGSVHVETLSATGCYVGFYWDDGRICQWWISSSRKLAYHHEVSQSKSNPIPSQTGEGEK